MAMPALASESGPRAEPSAPSPHELGADFRGLARAAADVAFALLLLVIVLLLGWHAGRHDRYWDWTTTGRNSLSAESIAALDRLEDPLRITVYAPTDHRIARSVEQLLARYRKHSAKISVEYVDPARFPERARGENVRLLGQLVLTYRGRRETLTLLDEETLTNAVARLTLPYIPWVAVLEGHGERTVTGAAGPDLGRFAQLLHQRGFRLQPVDLARMPAIPDNADLLLVSTPSIALFPGEVEALLDYVDRGGNLLWLLEPGDLLGLEPLAQRLGIAPLPGQIVDAKAAGLGLDSPTFAVVDDWPEHPLGRALTDPAVLPGSLGFAVRAAPGWLLDTTLTTSPQSWNETGPIKDEVTLDETAGEQSGPIPVGLALSRELPDPDAADAEHSQQRIQRILVLGDGDFLSNAYLANGANQILGLRAVRWLAGQEDLVTLPERTRDTDALVLSPPRAWTLVGPGLIGLPVLLIGAGLLVGRYRGRG